MSRSATDYNISVIAKLLLAAFAAEDLRRFCRDHLTFTPVLSRFGPGQGLDDMVDEVIDYCRTRQLLATLLSEVEAENPRQYARFEPFLLCDGEAISVRILKPGSILGRGKYRVVRHVARGGFGSVYLAEDVLLQEEIAIKEMVPALVGDEDAIKRFLVEAKTTMKLAHPHIAATREVFSEGSNYYMLIEWASGGSLEDRLKRESALPVEDLVRIAAEVAEGLAYAHSRGVIHCDLKPSNILLTSDGSAKVADFGIAHVSEHALTRTWTTGEAFVAGTLPYMSPEQTDGVRDDPRVDVYALGAVLYRALTGRTYVEFDERDTPHAQSENVKLIWTARPLPPSTYNERVPAWLDKVVLKALSKRPETRYLTMGALRASLLRSQRHHAGSAPVAAGSGLPVVSAQCEPAEPGTGVLPSHSLAEGQEEKMPALAAELPDAGRPYVEVAEAPIAAAGPPAAIPSVSATPEDRPEEPAAPAPGLVRDAERRADAGTQEATCLVQPRADAPPIVAPWPARPKSGAKLATQAKRGPLKQAWLVVGAGVAVIVLVVVVTLIALSQPWRPSQGVTATIMAVAVQVTRVPTRTASPTLREATRPAMPPTATPVPPSKTRRPTSTRLPPTLTAIPDTATPKPLPPAAGATRVKDGKTMVYVPAGEFFMGVAVDATPMPAGVLPEEKPGHMVYLDGFWIDRTEVTNDVFQRFVGKTGYRTDAEVAGWSYEFSPQPKPSFDFWSPKEGLDWRDPLGPATDLSGNENLPVARVSWNDANEFCAWVGGRLPTEAEWEKAARGADSRYYPWGSKWSPQDRLNFADKSSTLWYRDSYVDDGYEFLAPIGSYPKGASPYGALDMLGNAWEWVADWYDEGYYSHSPATNPKGPSSGTKRSLRGGSWGDGTVYLRVTSRFGFAPEESWGFGFRCAYD